MRNGLIAAALIVAVGLTAWPQASSQPIRARKGLVISASSIASEVGAEALKDGGTAVDAVVATALAMAPSSVHGNVTAPHDVEVLIDRERISLATVKPVGADKNAEIVDAHLKFRVKVKAGPRTVGITFVRRNAETIVSETDRVARIVEQLLRYARRRPSGPAIEVTAMCLPMLIPGAASASPLGQAVHGVQRAGR